MGHYFRCHRAGPGQTTRAGSRTGPDYVWSHLRAAAVKSAESVGYEILRDVLRAARAYECESLRVLASPSVIERLLDEDSVGGRPGEIYQPHYPLG